MDEDNIIDLSEAQQDAIFPSLFFLTTNLEEFIKKLFNSILETKTAMLFEKTNIELLEKKFQTVFKVILYNIQHPINLKGQLDLIISKHKDFGIMPENIEEFHKCFLKTLGIVLQNKAADNILALWDKILNQIFSYFQKKLF